MPQEEQFVETYKTLNIERAELPQYTIEKIPYSKEEPIFVVAWIKDALSSFFKQK